MKEEGRVHEACKWCYRGLWGILTRYLKLPKDPPEIPSEEGEHIEYLHPSEAYLKYRKFHFWIALLVVDIALTIGWITLFILWPLAGVLITPLALAIIVLPDIFAYIAIHLRFDTTWYVLSDRSMRLRRGVWNIHETTIRYDNIQNIHIHQGPMQRWFGFSNLVVETAGGGGDAKMHGSMGMGAHVGFLEGLDNAQTIREQILARCGRSTGLGDERASPPSSDSVGPARSPFSADQLSLLRSIRDATKQLVEE